MNEIFQRHVTEWHYVFVVEAKQDRTPFIYVCLNVYLLIDNKSTCSYVVELNINLENMSVLWLTGFSGAGKSTIAEKLSTLIESCQIVDGDVIRRTISSDLKQGETDRNEHFRRVINYIKSNITKSEFTIAAFVSANKTQREWIRTKGSIIYFFYERYLSRHKQNFFI